MSRTKKNHELVTELFHPNPDTGISRVILIDEINKVITTKAMLMYDKMKLGVVINIFNEMIENKEMDEVFDIIIRLKDKRVMKILKKLDTKISTEIMQRLRKHKEELKKEEKK